MSNNYVIVACVKCAGLLFALALDAVNVVACKKRVCPDAQGGLPNEQGLVPMNRGWGLPMNRGLSPMNSMPPTTKKTKLA